MCVFIYIYLIYSSKNPLRWGKQFLFSNNKEIRLLILISSLTCLDRYKISLKILTYLINLFFLFIVCFFLGIFIIIIHYEVNLSNMFLQDNYNNIFKFKYFLYYNEQLVGSAIKNSQ